MAVLLWVYYSAWIVFFGAEFTQAWVRAHGRRIVPDAEAVKVTDGERAQRGMVSDERLERKTREQQPAAGKGAAGAGAAGRREPRSSEWEVKEQEWD